MMVLSTDDPHYRQCSLSVMDNIADPHITFDEEGICNYYYDYCNAARSQVFTDAEGEQKLQEWVNVIREAGKGKKYDCITGVSGGVDSTYLTLQAKRLGLRPLVVHFDNGWNSELSVKNIENIISKLGFDLYTLVVDWNEFRDIQLAYLKASVVDIEAITDHAIIGTLYRLAVEHNIKYILSGTNLVTEFVLPRHWIWSKTDHVNIQDIHRKFGRLPLRTFPYFNKRLKHYYARTRGIHSVALLNYMPYVKSEVKQVIGEELSWRDYGGKHYESVFTRFYQGYILPTKFKIDKRKAHLSTLIFSGQLTRAQALTELEKPIYDPELLRTDYEFVLKKFDMTSAEFEALMVQPRREHTEFAHEKSTIWENYPWLQPFRGLWRQLKGS